MGNRYLIILSIQILKLEISWCDRYQMLAFLERKNGNRLLLRASCAIRVLPWVEHNCPMSLTWS
jgi:hypothetical protein